MMTKHHAMSYIRPQYCQCHCLNPLAAILCPLLNKRITQFQQNHHGVFICSSCFTFIIKRNNFRVIFIYSMSWLLIFWVLVWPGHQQQFFLCCSPTLLLSQHSQGQCCITIGNGAELLKWDLCRAFSKDHFCNQCMPSNSHEPITT